MTNATVIAEDAGLTATDYFCGAGGSSQGLHAAGFRSRLAANHWDRAIESHATNFPETEHFQGDIHEVNVRQLPRTDLFWASPECPTWSNARGEKEDFTQQATFGDVAPNGEAEDWGPLPDEATQRSRALMWDVHRHLEEMISRGQPVLVGVVENVIQVRKWIMWSTWIGDLHALGYKTRVIALNSMHAEAVTTPRAPQSRDRLYVAYWHRSLGRDPNWAKWLRPTAWCSTCDEQVKAVQVFKKSDADMGRYRSQYVYRCPRVTCRNQILEPATLPAAAAIDWTLAARRIGDRDEPLAQKTLARIEAGLRRYSRPITLEAAGHTFERRPGVRTRPVDWPLTTLHTTQSKGVACPPMMVPAGGTWNDDARPISEPLRARTTRDNEALVVPPLLVPVEGREGVDARPIDGPLRTQTARLQDALVVPLRNNGVPRTVDWPFPTFAAAGQHHALVMRNNTARGDQGQMSTPIDEPLRTLTTAGHQSLIRWDHLLYGYDSGALRTIADVLPTQTTVEGDALLGPEIQVEDCTFRMLEPHEIGAGMAFTARYIVLGNKRERVRQYGNAVTPPVAEVLGLALRECVTGEELAA